MKRSRRLLTLGILIVMLSMINAKRARMPLDEIEMRGAAAEVQASVIATQS
jgi:hypothetical protein